MPKRTRKLSLRLDKRLVRAKAKAMRELFLKKHGVAVRGTIDPGEQGKHIAYVIVSEGDEKQVRGPAFWSTVLEARLWIIRQAAIHGFEEEDIFFGGSS